MMGEAKRPIPRWAGRVTFGNYRYDEKPVLLTVEATTPMVAVTRAVREARRKLPTRIRVERISVMLVRLRTLKRVGMMFTILLELLTRFIEWARPRRQRCFEIPTRFQDPGAAKAIALYPR